jgi:hypothetical protein
MSTNKTVPAEKQLTVIARVEPGSLGPDGLDKIEGFCRHANQNMVSVGQRYTRWRIIPRYDKTLPEMEYYIQHKKLNNFQVSKYLGFFQTDLEVFEEAFSVHLTLVIEQYLNIEIQ